MKISSINDDEHRKISFGSLKLHWPFPVAYLTHSSSARVLGYCVYGENVPSLVDWLHSRFQDFIDAKYWVYYRILPKHQHHIIRTGLAPGYWCEDNRILHGCMACLEAYVKDEGGVEKILEWIKELNITDSNDSKEICNRQAANLTEALEIYRWWKIEKPTDEFRQNELCHELYGQKDLMMIIPVEGSTMKQAKFRDWTPEEQVKYDEMQVLDQKIEEDEQKMLHRLIDIRRSLWT